MDKKDREERDREDLYEKTYSVAKTLANINRGDAYQNLPSVKKSDLIAELDIMPWGQTDWQPVFNDLEARRWFSHIQHDGEEFYIVNKK
jgi:hypothetical protein